MKTLKFLDKNITENKVELLPYTDLVCFCIPNFLSNQECKEIISNECENKFYTANKKYPPSYRNNSRVETNNISLSKKLFHQSLKYIPITYNDPTIGQANRPWKVHSLNSRIRYCKYSTQEFFSTHKDGVFHLDNTSESKLTFIIYLNGDEDFSGGRTLFFNNQGDSEEIAAYTPGTGDLIIFDHNIWHSGETVTYGDKYILRTDIIYSNNIATDIENHKGYIWSSCVLHNNCLATAGRDKTIRIWNENLELQQILKSHHYSVLDIAARKNGDIFSVSRDGFLIKWVRNNNSYSEGFKVDTNHPTALSVNIHQDNLIITTGSDGKINYWSAEGQFIASSQEHDSWIWKSISIDEFLIATCSENGLVKIIDTRTKKIIASTPSYTDPVRCLFYNLESKLIYAGNNIGEITELDINDDLKELRKWKAHNGIVRDICSDKKGNLISCSEDNQIKFINIMDNLSTTIFKHSNFVTSLLRVKNTLYSTSYDGKLIKHKLKSFS